MVRKLQQYTLYAFKKLVHEPHRDQFNSTLLMERRQSPTNRPAEGHLFIHVCSYALLIPVETLFYCFVSQS